MASPLTVYGDPDDGRLYCYSEDYSTARAGGGTLTATTNIGAGQYLTGSTYQCNEGFCAFDTTEIGDNTVTSVVLSLCGLADYSTTDFTCQARLYDWGAAVTTADWVAGASLSGLTLLATFATSGFAGFPDYNVFTSDAAFLDNINGSGMTSLIIVGDRTVAGTQPSGREDVQFVGAATEGTDYDPKLVIEYGEAGNTTSVAAVLSALVSASTVTNTPPARALSAAATMGGLVCAAQLEHPPVLSGEQVGDDIVFEWVV